MGIYQSFNGINELIDSDDRLPVEEKSVKQMLIEKGEWTKADDQIKLESLKPSLNQITNFRHYAEDDEHFQIFDWSNNNLDQMSLTEFSRLKWLWTENKYIQAKKILEKYLKLK